MQLDLRPHLCESLLFIPLFFLRDSKAHGCDSLYWFLALFLFKCFLFQFSVLSMHPPLQIKKIKKKEKWVESKPSPIYQFSLIGLFRSSTHPS